MARIKFFLISLALLITLSMFAQAESLITATETDQAKIDAVFPKLSVNDAQAKAAEFTMKAPGENILSSNTFSLVFNEVCGHVNSYKVMIRQNITKQRNVYKDVEQCGDVFAYDKDAGKNITVKSCAYVPEVTGTEDYIAEEWVETGSIYTGETDYRIEADITPARCAEYTYGYQIDWKPVLNTGNIIYSKNFIKDEWAWWNSTYNLSTGLTAYFDMDTSGSLVSKVGSFPIAEVGTVPLNTTDAIINASRGNFTPANYFKNDTPATGTARDWTINLWIKRTGVTAGSNFAIVVGRSNSGDTCRNLAISSRYTTGSLDLYADGNGFSCDEDALSKQMHLNTWTMVTFVQYTNLSIRLYQNATLLPCQDYEATACTGSNLIAFGNWVASTSYPATETLVDEVAIYDGVALNQTQIDILWNNGQGLAYQPNAPASSGVAVNITSLILKPYPAYDSSVLQCNTTIRGVNATYTAKYSFYNSTAVISTGQTDAIANNTNSQVATLAAASTNLGDTIYCQINATHDMSSYVVTNTSAYISGIAFVSANPSDLTLFNLLPVVYLNVSYKIYSVAGYTNHSVKIFAKTNTSTSDVSYSYNGTSVVGYYKNSWTANNSETYTFRLSENGVYRGTYNKLTDDTAAHEFVTFGSSNERIIQQILNVSSMQYNVLEFMINSTAGSTAPLTVRYCNQSFILANGNDPVGSSSCGICGSLAANPGYGHIHSTNSAHNNLTLPANITAGTLCGVKVTANSSFAFSSINPNSYDAHYTNGAIRPAAWGYTANGGNTWVLDAATLDMHLHQYTNDSIHYDYACYEDYGQTIRYYSFDQNSSTTAIDQSPSGKNANVYANWTNLGKYGGAYDFYQNATYIPTTAVIDPNGTSLGMWVKTNSMYPAVDWQMIFSNRETSNNNRVFLGRITGGTYALFTRNTTTTQVAYSSLVYPAGQWDHVIITVNGSVYKMYINGAFSSSTTCVEDCGLNNPIYIGRNGDLSEYYFNGTIDEFKIWNKVLSPADVTAEYQDQGDVCSAVRADPIDLITIPPTSPLVFSPLSSKYGTRVYINWTASTSFTGAILSYNVTIVNATNSNLYTVSNNTPTNLTSSFCAKDYQGSGLYAKVTAFTNDSETSFGLSTNFTTSYYTNIYYGAEVANGTKITSYGPLPYLLNFSCAVNRSATDIPITINLCFANSSDSVTCVIDPIYSYLSYANYYKDNVSLNFTSTFFKQGSYKFWCEVEAVDCIPKVITSNISFLVDTAAPTLTIAQPTADEKFYKNFTAAWPIPIQYNYTAQDYYGIDKCWYTGTNITPAHPITDPVACTNFTLNVSEYGYHTLTLFANDTNGLVTNATRRIVINQYISIMPGYGSSYYSGYYNLANNNYTRTLLYSFDYNCYNTTVLPSLKIVTGYDYDLSALTCDGATHNANGTYPLTPAANIMDVGISIFDNSTLVATSYGEQTFYISLTAPTATLDVYVNGTGFIPVIGGAFNITSGAGIFAALTCTDDIVPILRYSIYWQNNTFGYVMANFTAGTEIEITTPLPYNGLNEFKGVCNNFFDNSTAAYQFRHYYLTNITLVDEVTGGLLDITNISSVKIYNDNNMTIFDFKATNASEVWYFSELSSSTSTKLRFEFVYPGGTIINRYLDASLFATGQIRVCGNQDGTTFYTLKVTSASYRPTLVESMFAKCYVAGDYTRFAYEQLYTLPMYTIARAYRVYKFVGNDATMLVDIDGSATTDVSLDTIEFYQTNYTIDVRGEGLAIKQTGTAGTMAIYYKNGQDNNLAAVLQIYRTDTNALVYTASNFSDPNEFSTTVNIVSLGLTNITNSTVFKAKITKTTQLGTSTISKYFNLLGRTNILKAEFAIVIAILLTIFGLTFTAVKTTFGWLGMVTGFISIVILSMSMAAWYITFWMVINVIIIIYILLGLLGRNMPSLVS